MKPDTAQKILQIALIHMDKRITDKEAVKRVRDVITEEMNKK